MASNTHPKFDLNYCRINLQNKTLLFPQHHVLHFNHQDSSKENADLRKQSQKGPKWRQVAGTWNSSLDLGATLLLVKGSEGGVLNPRV